MFKPIFKVKNSSQIYITFLNKGPNYACLRGFFNTNVYLYKRFSLRYGILLLTLFILSNSFSLVLLTACMILKEKKLILEHVTWIHIRIIYQLFQEHLRRTLVLSAQRLDSGIYQAHILQILKKLPDQILQ